MRDKGSGDVYRVAAAVVILIASVLLAARVTGNVRSANEAAGYRATGDTREAADGGKADGAKKADVDFDLAATPEDVLALRNDFAKRYLPEEGEDAVKERFFVTDNADAVVDNVAIRNGTETLSPDFAALLEEVPALAVADAARPTVLVFHTHTSESYALNGDGLYYPSQPTHTGQADRNVLRIGDELCAALEHRGVGVIHDRAVYDDEYDGAYARSREAALDYLEQYPSLQVVIDVHRDALTEEGRHVKPTALIGGKKAAQIMILTGAEENGTEFPHWEKNLRFALRLQETAQEKYPGLMKPLFFCPRRYNMDLTENGLLLEIGTEVNTLEEAVYSARLIGDALADVVLAAEG